MHLKINLQTCVTCIALYFVSVFNTYYVSVFQLPEIKLVDPRKGEHPLVHFALQLMGMLTGSGIMLLIALYEDRLHLE